MKILAAIPLRYREGGEFWNRDLGLVVLALRSAGHDAMFVALGDENHVADRPLKLITRQAMGDPAWWQAQQPDGIILNAWSATRYQDIRDAALSVGCPLVEKMDTDGVRSPRTWFWGYVREGWSDNRDQSSALRRFLAGPLSFVRACLLWCFPNLLDTKLAVTMSRTPVLAPETPIAVERIKRFIRDMNQPVPRVICIPHAVGPMFGISCDLQKTNKVIAVGRWSAHMKNFPLLLQILDDFLVLHPHWSAEVVGGIPENLPTLLSRHRKESTERIAFPGKLDSSELSRRLQKSKIFLISSRYESFNIAAAEALCCGCSVVGPVEIPSVPYFCGHSSGTPACRYTATHLLDALAAEATAWHEGWRNSEQISAEWKQTVGVNAVAKQLVEAMQLHEQKL